MSEMPFNTLADFCLEVFVDLDDDLRDAFLFFAAVRVDAFAVVFF